MIYYGLARDFGQAGYFETEQSRQLLKELKLTIQAGKLVALSGIVGCGKTTTLRHVQEQLGKDKDFLVAKSLSVEKSQISLGTLIMALFYDISTEKDFKIPTQPERLERALRDLIKRRQKTIALFIDEAHDLHSKTLVGLKRLMEVVRDGGGILSVILAGHPKLKTIYGVHRWRKSAPELLSSNWKDSAAKRGSMYNGLLGNLSRRKSRLIRSLRRRH
jgi:type II secretory pathway predicted ATPase ExeA